MPWVTAGIGLLAAIGTLLAGYAAYDRVVEKRRTNPMEAVALAVQAYVDMNSVLRTENASMRDGYNDLRERAARLETDVAKCEDSKRAQGIRIGVLEQRLAKLEGDGTK